MKKFLFTPLFIFLICSGSEPQNPNSKYFVDGFLDTLQQRTFFFFWDVTDATTGLTPDRYPTESFSSTAAIGFALTSYGIGAHREYITREAAANRVLTTLQYLYTLPQGNAVMGNAGFQGFFYHFLNFRDGTRFNKDVELSTIDTALLMAGVLFCQSYFDGNESAEKSIRAYADSLYLRVNWEWIQTRPPVISMGWYPDRGFLQSDWHGYNEAMILYVLALGSPTHRVNEDAWDSFTKNYKWLSYFGEQFVSFGPLFGHQYSHSWIDFRGISDAYMREKGIDYHENSRRATLSQQLYAMNNPRKLKGFSEHIWGLTACDGPADQTLRIDGIERRFNTYHARGVSADWIHDDGTIAPTAAGGSVAFAPEICVPTLKAMRDQIPGLWTEYGFLDAFNPTYVTEKTPDGWVDHDYLGIDQGPIVIMIENLRSGLVWDVMKKNPYIVKGLQRAGFTGGWLDKKTEKK